MSCDEYERWWPAWSAGDLSGRKQRVFDAHLRACPGCREWARAMERASELARQVLTTESESMSRAERLRMLDGLETERPARRWIWTSVAATAVAALLALMLWLPGKTPTGTSMDGGTVMLDELDEEISLVDAAARADRYEMRLATSDPKVKIVWVFDRNLDI